MAPLSMSYVDRNGQSTAFLFIGRTFFALGIVGIGLIHFIFPGLQPLILPLPAETVWSGFGYAVGGLLTATGIAILINRKPQTSSLFLGVLFLLFLIVGHLPNRLTHHPGILGYWTDALKLMALAGGALTLAGTHGKTELAGVPGNLIHLASCGKYLYGFMLILFGIDHFIYADSVKLMLPGWMPVPRFWVYITGLALIGSGLAIAIRVSASVIMLLLAVMLFLWLLLLHIPGTINHPNAISAISSFECLSFSGIALLLVDFYKQREVVPASEPSKS